MQDKEKEPDNGEEMILKLFLAMCINDSGKLKNFLPNEVKKGIKEMRTTKTIIGESGEDCKVDIDILHEGLLGLPAELYLKLYHKMQENVLGYAPFYNGYCVPATIEDKPEEPTEPQE